MKSNMEQSNENNNIFSTEIINLLRKLFGHPLRSFYKLTKGICKIEQGDKMSRDMIELGSWFVSTPTELENNLKFNGGFRAEERRI